MIDAPPPDSMAPDGLPGLSARVRVQRDGFGPVRFEVDGDYAARKRRGLFFTPWGVSMTLARMAAAELSDADRRRRLLVGDPFAGAGVLLAALVEALVDGVDDVSEMVSRRRILGGTYGLDLDDDMLRLARRVLSAGEPDLLGADQLVRADSLLSPLQPAELFETSSLATALPAVFDQGGFDVVITNPPWEKVRVNDREFFDSYDPGFSRRPRAERDERRRELLERPVVAAAYERMVGRVARLKAAARQQYETAGSGGDLDTYKLAVERALELTRPGGLTALIVPHGLLGDWGARHLRRWLLARHTIVEIRRFETGPTLFPEIHANLGVVLLLVRRGRSSSDGVIGVSATITEAARLEEPTIIDVPRRLLDAATPHHMVPLVDRPEDIAFVERCLAHPALGDWSPEHFQPRREVDMTNDRHRFVALGCGVPLLEGKHIGPYRVDLGARRYDLAGPPVDSSRSARVAWRAVADRAMRRRLIGAWIRPGVCLGNSLVATTASGSDANERLLWLLAWLNSRVADAQLRLWCANNNINIFHVRCCRVPRWRDDAVQREVVELAERLLRDVDSAAWRSGAIERIDEHWRTIYDVPIDIWRAAVHDRTTSVADWGTDPPPRSSAQCDGRDDQRDGDGDAGSR